MTLFDIFVSAIAQAADRRRVLPRSRVGNDGIVFSSEPDFGYESTSSERLDLRRDGRRWVLNAILKIDGAVTDESPVIHVSPISKPCAVLAEPILPTRLLPGVASLCAWRDDANSVHTLLQFCS